VRLDTAAAAPQPPPLSPPEAARSVVAGGARAAVRVLTTADPATLPGDVPGRVAGWVEVHRSHLAALADPAAAPFPAGTGEAVPDLLRAGDPVRTIAELLGGLGAAAAAAAVSAPGAAPVHLRIAAARWAQEHQLLTAAGRPPRAVPWPPAPPVDVLQAVLAAEHAVIDGYTTAAAWDGGRRGAYLAAAARHEGARDRLVGAVREAGAIPVPAAPGYAVPADAAPGAGPVPQRALTLAVAVEAGLARAAVAAAVSRLAASEDAGRDEGAASSDARQLAAALTAVAAEAEVARQSWGAPPQALPGS
jgi:hypothetical protein